MDKINTTSEALSYLYDLSLNESSFKFRGQADSSWLLNPTIYRFSDFKRYQAIIFEGHLISAKPKEPAPPLTHTNHELEWLMVCQHYEIPTRLLDWSSDILIALYFACSDKNEFDKDGALFVCNQLDYPLYSIYHQKLREEQSLVFVSTNIINPRMRFQSGSFMLWGASPLNENSTESYDLWEYHLENNKNEFLKKVTIPSESKERILNELNQIYSISNNTIYLQNGFLEKAYGPKFPALKEQLRLMTLYQTTSEKLSSQEKKKARSYFRIDCENMYGECIRLSKY